MSKKQQDAKPLATGEFLTLAYSYAQACDRKDVELLLSTLAADAEIVMPGNIMSGHDQLAGVPSMLADMFESTQHKVFNQTVVLNSGADDGLDEESAKGETYCTASHIRLLDDGKREVEDWAIRYQDEYVKTEGRWIYTRRELLIDWVEVRPVMAFGEQFT